MLVCAINSNGLGSSSVASSIIKSLCADPCSRYNSYIVYVKSGSSLHYSLDSFGLPSGFILRPLPNLQTTQIFQFFFRLFYRPQADCVLVLDDFPFLRVPKQIVFLQQALLVYPFKRRYFVGLSTSCLWILKRALFRMLSYSRPIFVVQTEHMSQQLFSSIGQHSYICRHQVF